MKVIFDECTQAKAYQDSYGTCLVELEPGDNAEIIIGNFTKKREWFEQDYRNPSRRNTFTYKKWGNGAYEDVTVNGDLILFDTHQTFLD